MLNVAVTGNAGSGKSTVVKWFRKWGATVIDADEIVRELQAPGTPVLAEIIRQFGSQFLLPDGSLDRGALRRRVMGDEAALSRLNAIVHPAVQRRRDEIAAAASARGDRIVVNEIPLLFEALDPGDFDLVVLVDAPESVRRQRLIHQRALSEGEADRLLASQLPSGPKRTQSHIVIENDGSLAELEHQAKEVWREILQRA
jgi:dephospho-CoA kinase